MSEPKGMTVFNTSTTVDTKKQPMFFGAPLGVQRYDSYKYPVFDKLTQQQLGYFWRPEEVSLQAYDEFINYAQEWGSSNLWSQNSKGSPSSQWTQKDLKRYLYRAVANVNILEGIRFYVSFACSFAFGELKLMEGSAKIISLIARDENQHLVITQTILNNWLKGDDPDMIEIAKEEKGWLVNAFKSAVQQEKEWAEYLFKDGSMIGLNEKLLGQYVEWIANKRMRAIGIDPIYDIAMRNNPLPWTTHWISSKGLQVAPQETEVESYVVGGIKQDVKKDTFSGFKL